MDLLTLYSIFACFTFSVYRFLNYSFFGYSNDDIIHDGFDRKHNRWHLLTKSPFDQQKSDILQWKEREHDTLKIRI